MWDTCCIVFIFGSNKEVIKNLIKSSFWILLLIQAHSVQRNKQKHQVTPSFLSVLLWNKKGNKKWNKKTYCAVRVSPTGPENSFIFTPSRLFIPRAKHLIPSVRQSLVSDLKTKGWTLSYLINSCVLIIVTHKILQVCIYTHLVDCWAVLSTMCNFCDA